MCLMTSFRGITVDGVFAELPPRPMKCCSEDHYRRGSSRG